ncbi:MAG: SigmaK-factor processing regulatory BofA [Firmicutes bacterium]|nr:SigmaK-factor processing regulatory BofA [Bacillota bacterium]
MELVYTVGYYLLGLLIAYFLAKLIYAPFKAIVQIIFNGIIGGLVLIGFNLVSSLFGLKVIGINPITALIVGSLGVPGLFLLLILRYLIF